MSDDAPRLPPGLPEGSILGSPPCVAWTPTMDARTRPAHADWDKVLTAWPEDVLPPLDLGRFNCRGDYVYRDGTVIRRRSDHRFDDLTCFCQKCGRSMIAAVEGAPCVTRWPDGFSVPPPPMRGRIVEVRA